MESHWSQYNAGTFVAEVALQPASESQRALPPGTTLLLRPGSIRRLRLPGAPPAAGTTSHSILPDTESRARYSTP
eukprot:1510805-Rhodomonas_salina.2